MALVSISGAPGRALDGVFVFRGSGHGGRSLRVRLRHAPVPRGRWPTIGPERQLNRPGATLGDYGAGWKRCRQRVAGEVGPAGGPSFDTSERARMTIDMLAGFGLPGALMGSTAQPEVQRTSRASCLPVGGRRKVQPTAELAARLRQAAPAEKAAIVARPVGLEALPAQEIRGHDNRFAKAVPRCAGVLPAVGPAPSARLRAPVAGAAAPAAGQQRVSSAKAAHARHAGRHGRAGGTLPEAGEQAMAMPWRSSPAISRRGSRSSRARSRPARRSA